MNQLQLVLASQSPRRMELLQSLGYPFTTCPAVGEEVLLPEYTPHEMVQSLAQQKAKEVAEKYPDGVVIGGDTLVLLDGTLLGKPKTTAEAEKMIMSLQGNTHSVLTGISIISKEKTVSFVEETRVTFRGLTPSQVTHYVARGESLDKAGGYGIQGAGAFLVERLEGDFYNVMGLPLCALGKKLGEFGLFPFGEEG